MQTMVVVVVPPRFERLLQVLQVQETMQRETLASQGAVEGFDERIVHRLAGSAELERDMMPVGPVVQQLRGELGAIVDGDAPRRRSRRARRPRLTTWRRPRAPRTRARTHPGPSGSAPRARRPRCRA